MSHQKEEGEITTFFKRGDLVILYVNISDNTIPKSVKVEVLNIRYTGKKLDYEMKTVFNQIKFHTPRFPRDLLIARKIT
jgi:hypothetical protein